MSTEHHQYYTIPTGMAHPQTGELFTKITHYTELRYKWGGGIFSKLSSCTKTFSSQEYGKLRNRETLKPEEVHGQDLIGGPFVIAARIETDNGRWADVDTSNHSVIALG